MKTHQENFSIIKKIILGVGVFLASANVWAGAKLPQTVTIPINTKLAFPHAIVNLQVGNGITVPVSVDTGSNYLVIEESYVGQKVSRTNIKIPIKYVSKTVIGYLAFAPITYANNLLLHTESAPILIVPNGSFSKLVHGVMGMALKQKVASDRYLPYPYNQGFVINFAAHTLTFGLFPHFKGTQIQLKQIKCSISQFIPSAKNNCYNDNAIPVLYTFSGISPTLINGIFDSGGTATTVAMESLPSGASVDAKNRFTSPLTAQLYLNKQAVYNLSLTTNTKLYPPLYIKQKPGATPYSNLGFKIFSDNQIYFNPTNGTISIKLNNGNTGILPF